MNDHQMPLREHLIELRRRLTWAAAAVVVCTGVAFAFYPVILRLLMAPAKGFVGQGGQGPIFTDLTEFIGVAMKASLMVGLFASFPVVLYQVAMFVAPGLTPSERRYLYTLLPLSLLAFLGGAAFGYWVLFPPAIRFLLTFGSDIATPLIRIGNYVNLILSLLFWMGVVFEMPVVLFFLSRIGVVTPTFLAKNRKYAVVLAFALGAIITPTFDPINQTLVALPIMVLFEVSIWLARLGARGRRRASQRLSVNSETP